MIKLINNSRGALSLGGEFNLARNSTGMCDKEIWERYKNTPVIKSWVKDQKLVVGEIETEVVNDTPSDRDELIMEIINGLNEDEFTADQKPQVGAINEAMEPNAEPVTSQERDRIWGMMQ